MLRLLLQLVDKSSQIFVFIMIGFFVSLFFGGLLAFLKLIINIVLIVGGYWSGFSFITPLFEKLFKGLGWNKDLAVALGALLWLWGFFSIISIFSQTEVGQWLGDLS